MKFKKLKHRTITMLPLFLILLSVGALCKPVPEVPEVTSLIDETIEEIEAAQEEMINEKFSGPEESLAECKIQQLNTYIASLESNNASKQSKTTSERIKTLTKKLEEIRKQLKSIHRNEAELECDVEKETTSFYEFSKKLKEFLKLLKGSYGAQKR